MPTITFLTRVDSLYCTIPIIMIMASSYHTETSSKASTILIKTFSTQRYKVKHLELSLGLAWDWDVASGLSKRDHHPFHLQRRILPDRFPEL